MSAFHRFLFSIFLILALSFFGVGSALATDYYYFRSTDSSLCDLSEVSLSQHSYTSRFGSGVGQTVKYSLGPLSFSGTDPVAAFYQVKVSYYYNNQWSPVDNYQTPYQFAWKYKHTCPDGQTFKLDGCTATCELDPCKSKQGQKESVSVQCGTASCSSGVTVPVGSSAFTCSAGVARFSAQSPTGNAVKDSCAMVGITSEDLPTLADARAKTEDLGSSSVPMYCNYTYEYTGQSGGQDTPPNNASLTLSPFSGAILPDEQGNCDNPAYPIKGIKDGQNVCYPQDDGNNCPVDGEKENSNGVCVGPDDPTYPKDGDDPIKPKDDKSCPAGQIKNNAGKCVPYADATKCPAGEIRNAAGLCSNDPKSNSCSVGQVKNSITGACSNDPKGTGCADGSLPDKQGLCSNGKAACPAGQTRDSLGVCVGSNPDKPDGTGCKDGSTPNASGVCADGSGACPIGQLRDNKGKCVLDTTETPKSGTASSDCLVPPECAGDPLQCASLEQIWRSTCEQTKALLNISEDGKAAVDASIAASKSEADGVRAAVDAEVSGFFSDFQSDAQVASTSQCMQDASFPVMGKSLNVPFSKACDFFRFLRILLLFSAYMISAQIIFRGAV